MGDKRSEGRFKLTRACRVVVGCEACEIHRHEAVSLAQYMKAAYLLTLLDPTVDEL